MAPFKYALRKLLKEAYLVLIHALVRGGIMQPSLDPDALLPSVLGVIYVLL